MLSLHGHNVECVGIRAERAAPSAHVAQALPPDTESGFRLFKPQQHGRASHRASATWPSLTLSILQFGECELGVEQMVMHCHSRIRGQQQHHNRACLPGMQEAISHGQHFVR